MRRAHPADELRGVLLPGSRLALNQHVPGRGGEPAQLGAHRHGERRITGKHGDVVVDYAGRGRPEHQQRVAQPDDGAIAERDALAGLEGASVDEASVPAVGVHQGPAEDSGVDPDVAPGDAPIVQHEICGVVVAVGAPDAEAGRRDLPHRAGRVPVQDRACARHVHPWARRAAPSPPGSVCSDPPIAPHPFRPRVAPEQDNSPIAPAGKQGPPRRGAKRAAPGTPRAIQADVSIASRFAGGHAMRTSVIFSIASSRRTSSVRRSRSCAARPPPVPSATRKTPSARSARWARPSATLAPCDGVSIDARRNYRPARWTDGHADVAGSALTFALPAAIPVTFGAAGNGVVKLVFSSDNGAPTTCVYRGNGSGGHGGRRYLFRRCETAPTSAMTMTGLMGAAAARNPPWSPAARSRPTRSPSTSCAATRASGPPSSTCPSPARCRHGALPRQGQLPRPHPRGAGRQRAGLLRLPHGSRSGSS